MLLLVIPRATAGGVLCVLFSLFFFDPFRYEIVWECREQMSWPLHRSQLDHVQNRINEMDRMLVAYMLPWSPSGCQSEKHHQWSHYSHHRLNTGCAAKEYAFERSYAVGHKKHIQFTNKAATKALQTSAKHWFRNGVHRLAVHLQILDHTEEDDDPAYRTDRLECAGSARDFQWTSDALARSMRLKAASMDPPLTRASSTLHLTLKNRMTARGKPGRMPSVILRAKHFGKHPWVDNIRVQYEVDGDVPAVGFAKCLGFFGDSSNNNHVAIQWYKICGRLPLDRIARMCKVELIDSFQYIPVGSILNGALIVPLATKPLPGYPQQCWVIQSHRESTSLARLNA